jgi:DNA-binding MarR family transcriptional regulator
MFFLKELPTRKMLHTYSRKHIDMDIDAMEAALQLLRRASLLMRELEAYFAARGSSQTRFLTMMVIDREPEKWALRPSEIADRLDVSRQVITDTINALVQRGLLSSSRAAGDGRIKCVSLTCDGKKMLADMLPGYFALIKDFMTRDT